MEPVETGPPFAFYSTEQRNHGVLLFLRRRQLCQASFCLHVIKRSFEEETGNAQKIVGWIEAHSLQAIYNFVLRGVTEQGIDQNNSC